MEQMNVIITSLQSWDIPIGSNAVDIAKKLSQKHKVLYVNAPLDQSTLLKGEKKKEYNYRLDVLHKKADPLRQINENLWVISFPFSVWSINGLPDGFLFDFFNKLNNKKTFKYVSKVAEDLGFKDVIHFIDNDIYRSFYSREFLRSKLSVYYRRDNLQPYPYWNKHVARVEPLIIQKNDLVLCNSEYYRQFSLKTNPNSFTIGQGVDLTTYLPDEKYDLPENLKDIPTPRIGYIGDITSLRLDPDLIHDLAKSKPDYSFVMIGGEDDVFKNHAMHDLDNVYFLGRVPPSTVSQYIYWMDICLNPQKLNEITIGNYPRKVDEYLAMGKPVIATKTLAMDMFKDHCYLCEDLQQYQDAVERALQEDDTEKQKIRIDFANSHSWDNNIEVILSFFRKFSQ